MTSSLTNRLLISLTLFVFAATAPANTFSVLNENSSGTGSLAQAILNANSSPGDDTITFDIPGAGPHMINLTSVLPDLSSNIEILNDRPGDEAVTVQRSVGATEFRIFRITPGTKVLIAGLTIANGSTPTGQSGGGIYNDRGALTVRNCSLIGNSVSNDMGGGGGGGILNSAAGGVATTDLINCTLSGNRTNRYGAGVANYNDVAGGSATLRLINCTLSGNDATIDGGGIMNRGVSGNANVSLTNCTFSGNSSGVGSFGSGGGIRNAGGTAQLQNTILRRGSSGDNISNAGTFTSLGHNLSDDPAGGDGGPGPGGFLSGPGDIRNTNPTLGPLQDNGGRTLTHRLLVGSPAIDAGDDAVLGPPFTLSTDQRGVGFPRKVGASVDIGAIEVGPAQSGPTFTVTTTSEHDDGICTTDDCTLREALNAANANSDANIINFAPGLSGTILNTLVPGGLPITASLTIIGPGARVLTISGGNVARVFAISPGAVVNLSGLTITKGNSSGIGGGIFSDHGNLTLTECTVSGNTGYSGGGIFSRGSSSGSATLTMMNSTISGNVASGGLGEGGALYNEGLNGGTATMTLTNCTISGNTAPNLPAAAGFQSFGRSGTTNATLTNCTLNNNASSNDTANLSIANTILNGATITNAGTITSKGHNLSSDAAGGDGLKTPGGFLNATGDMRNTDPRLDTLKNNGGGTDTVALLLSGPASPAINAGGDALAPPTDQRGAARIGVSDIGAFESGGTPLGVPAITSATTANGNQNQAFSYQITATNSPTSFGAAGLPAGLNLNTTSGLISGTPSVTGTFNVTIGATNASGTGIATLTLTISPPCTYAIMPTSQNFFSSGGTGSVTINTSSSSCAWTATNNDPSFLTITSPASGTGNGTLSYSVAANSSTSSRTGTLTTAGQTFTITQTGAVPTPTPSATPTPTPVPTATPISTPLPALLGNISTRLRVETGDNVLFGGFFVTGTQPKRVIVRAIGPTLTAFGVPDALQNPTLELYSGQTLVTSNDNWVDAVNKQEIIDSTLAPKNDFESAILTSLAPGAYTAIVRGVNGGTGVGLVEVYDLGQTADSKLAQISTRGFVQTGDNVMFGGFFVLNGSQKVIIRAIGPSLPVNGKLADPTMELHDGNGALLEANDNWVDSPNKQAIIDSTVPPTNDFESAILRTLAPGPYTAIVRGKNDGIGIALVEVYALN